MAGKEPDYGPTARAVAANIERLRGDLSYTQLSEKLAARAVWPLTPVAIRRIEKRQRRVTVDDLMALAVALEVSPATLLTPYTEDMLDKVLITGSEAEIDSVRAHGWIGGNQPLSRTTSFVAFIARAWPPYLLKDVEKSEDIWGPLFNKITAETPRGDDQ